MSKIVRTETRKRGFFGKVFKVLFILFNLLMLAWLIAYWVQVGDIVNRAGDSSAAHTGAAIGATIGTGFIISFWAAGDVILGMLTLLSRGKKIIVEESVH
ncbi:MAG TPA: hypothetical protein VGU20_26055 [Stellaceae bacterium]|nr:hypothetical protein [Stellaceae bacterium]